MKIFLICIMLFFILLAVLLTLIVLKKLYIAIKFDGKFEVILKFFGFKIKLFPRDKKKNDKKKRDTDKDSMEQHDKEDEQGGLDKISDILSNDKKINAIFEFLSKIEIPEFKLNALIAFSDPYKTAVAYGGVCALTGALLPAAENILRIRSKDINICADFEKNSPMAEFYCVFSIRPIYILLFIYKMFIMSDKNKKGMD